MRIVLTPKRVQRDDDRHAQSDQHHLRD